MALLTFGNSVKICVLRNTHFMRREACFNNFEVACELENVHKRTIEMA